MREELLSHPVCRNNLRLGGGIMACLPCPAKPEVAISPPDIGK